jgi:hypothetical protein
LWGRPSQFVVCQALEAPRSWQVRKSRPPCRRLDPLKASPQARLPAPQGVLFHGVSRAKGPSQQGRKTRSPVPLEAGYHTTLDDFVGRLPGRPARTHKEPDQGARRGRGRPPHIWLRLCSSVGQTLPPVNSLRFSGPPVEPGPISPKPTAKHRDGSPARCHIQKPRPVRPVRPAPYRLGRHRRLRHLGLLGRPLAQPQQRPEAVRQGHHGRPKALRTR